MGNKPFSLSVKALVRDANGRYLLLKRSAASKGNAGKWEFPGGKLDPGESIDQALRREVAEETGLAVSVDRVAGATQSELPDRIIAYLVMEARAGTGPVHLSAEHDDFYGPTSTRWPEWTLCRRFGRSPKRMLKRWSNDNRFSRTASSSHQSSGE